MYRVEESIYLKPSKPPPTLLPPPKKIMYIYLSAGLRFDINWWLFHSSTTGYALVSSLSKI